MFKINAMKKIEFERPRNSAQIEALPFVEYCEVADDGWWVYLYDGHTTADGETMLHEFCSEHLIDTLMRGIYVND